MAERRIAVESVDPLLLFGFNDHYLRLVEGAFPETRIVARGNEVLLRGEEDVLDDIEQVLDELMLILSRNGNLTERDVETVLALSSLEGQAETPASSRDVILFTPKGSVRAKTPNQQQLVAKAREHDVTFAIGPAGTGKTYTAVALAVNALRSRQVKRIVISRPAVEAGETLGFLPGDLREKVDPYLRPLYDALNDMLPPEKVRAHLDRDVIEIVPLAYMRGRTLSSAFVILDEAQNATPQQMKMFLTRLGTNSRAIVTGDVTQTDLPSRQQSGLVQAERILHGVDGIGFVYFDRGDVVRHPLVQDIIDAYDRFEEG